MTIAVTGAPLAAVLNAADILKGEGIEAEILDYITVKPFDRNTLLESVAKTGLLVTVEEHSICGGLGSSAAETLGEVFPVAIKRIGMEDCLVRADLMHFYWKSTE